MFPFQPAGENEDQIGGPRGIVPGEPLVQPAQQERVVAGDIIGPRRGSHSRNHLKPTKFLARPERLELPTYWFEANAAPGINMLRHC